MEMRSRIGLAMMALAILACVAPVYAGPKWEFGDDSWMKLSFLGQAHYAFPDGQTYDQDFYIRRARIILMGQMTDGIKFFAETDNDKAGKQDMSVSTDIQDAFIDVRLCQTDNSELWAAGGLILLPFSFESKSSAASLLGLDYNAEAVKLVNTFVWRDMGAELHGNCGKKVVCRVGAFDGYDSEGGTKSDEADLRYTGHIAVNLLGDVESGWFPSQNRLGKEEHYISLGAGFDMQDKATAVTTTDADGVETETGQRDSEAMVIDMQSGFVLSDSASITLNAAYYDYDSAVFDGNTAFVETGVQLYKFMVTGKFSLQDPSEGEDTEDVTIGMHFFQKGHNARCGIEYRWGDSDDLVLAGVQFLL